MSASSYLQEQGFQDPYSYQPFGGDFGLGYDEYGKDGVSSGNSIWEKIVAGLGGTDNAARYENWLTERDRYYEHEATNSARAWDLWMDSTKIQRLMKDIQAAGLNPWLALQNGLSSGSSGSTAGSGSSARHHSSSSSRQDGLQKVAMALFTVAKLFAMFA